MKKTHKTTEIVVLIYINTKQTQTHVLRVLVDTGARALVILGKHCTKLIMKAVPTTMWTKRAGTSTTTQKAQWKFFLLEFNQNKIISWACHVDDTTTASNSQYNMILGQDLLDPRNYYQLQ